MIVKAGWCENCRREHYGANRTERHESPVTTPTYHFGWDEISQEFILWKRGKSTPVAVIPFADAKGLAGTVAHVATVKGQAELAKAAEAAWEAAEKALEGDH